MKRKRKTVKKKTSNPVGRPTVMTDEVVRKLETAFLLGCTDQEACFAAGIARSTLAVYVQNNPEFLDRKQALKSNPVFQARKTVLSAIQKGDAKTAMWLLERKRRKEFGPQAKTELTVSADVKPIDLNDWAAEQNAAFMGREILEGEKNCSDSSDT